MFLLIDNFDSFTFNLVQAFQVLGAEPMVVRNNRPELLELAHSGEVERVVISPGPGGPADSGLCPAFLDQLNPQIPLLGVCLGHQILAAHAGLEVDKGPRVMHGKTSPIEHTGDPLFEGISNPFEACRYHSLLVSGLTREAPVVPTCTSREGELMGLRYPERPWMGVQFHPESVLTPEGDRILANFLEFSR
ncbi:MAG: anthranilate synthase component II [Thermodesulfobacteriota bacterium]